MKRPPEPLTQEEVKALIEECLAKPRAGKRDAAILAVLYCCGLRSQEACDLDIRDFDRNQRTLHIRHGKGDRSRMVGVEPLAMKHLLAWLDIRGAAAGPLFLSRNGERLHPSYLRKFIPAAAKPAGIEKRVHPHGLRHTCAFEMANEGVPIYLIRDVLGHSNLSTTDTYLKRINPKLVLDAMRNRDRASTTYAALTR